MTVFALAIVMAVLVEALVEYAKTVIKAIENKDFKTAITQLVAIVLAVLLCFASRADVFSALGISFSANWIGVLLTGIFASRGSNYMSDLVRKVQSVISK